VAAAAAAAAAAATAAAAPVAAPRSGLQGHRVADSSDDECEEVDYSE
jgi:hypothetical protein